MQERKGRKDSAKDAKEKIHEEGLFCVLCGTFAPFAFGCF
jgi:hypothetical protein